MTDARDTTSALKETTAATALIDRPWTRRELNPTVVRQTVVSAVLQPIARDTMPLALLGYIGSLNIFGCQKPTSQPVRVLSAPAQDQTFALNKKQLGTAQKTLSVTLKQIYSVNTLL